MAENRQGLPRCRTLPTILAFLALLILIQWIGTALMGLNVGGTLISATLLAGIGVHVLCTLKPGVGQRTPDT